MDPANGYITEKKKEKTTERWKKRKTFSQKGKTFSGKRKNF